MVEIMRAASGEDSFAIIGATQVNAEYLKLLQGSVANPEAG
jgi:hypothetical protein